MLKGKANTFFRKVTGCLLVTAIITFSFNAIGCDKKNTSKKAVKNNKSVTSGKENSSTDSNDVYAAAKEAKANNPNYLKGVKKGDVSSQSGSCGSSEGSGGGSSSSASATTPAKYAGYHYVSARLSTVNSNEMIYVKYGSHTYGCKNQAEYDAVLSRVQEAVRNMPGLDPYITRYMNGDRAQNYAEGSEEYENLLGVYKNEGFFIHKVNNNATATTALRALALCARLNKQASEVEGPPNSAYDVLFRHQTDCDADAQLLSAIHDALGFSSMIVEDPSHADEDVCINGQWWCDTKPVNPNKVGHLTNPTY